MLANIAVPCCKLSGDAPNLYLMMILADVPQMPTVFASTIVLQQVSVFVEAHALAADSPTNGIATPLLSSFLPIALTLSTILTIFDC